MNFNDDDFADGQDDQTHYADKPGGRRADDGTGLTEADLERKFLFGKAEHANPTEGTGVGGQKFGEDAHTPAGNDKNNPTQMAGHTNAYFNRDEPSDEHPENSNFMPAYQDGEPDYDKAQPHDKTLRSRKPKSQKISEDDGWGHIET